MREVTSFLGSQYKFTNKGARNQYLFIGIRLHCTLSGSGDAYFIAWLYFFIQLLFDYFHLLIRNLLLSHILFYFKLSISRTHTLITTPPLSKINYIKNWCSDSGDNFILIFIIQLLGFGLSQLGFGFSPSSLYNCAIVLR